MRCFRYNGLQTHAPQISGKTFTKHLVENNSRLNFLFYLTLQILKSKELISTLYLILFLIQFLSYVPLQFQIFNCGTVLFQDDRIVFNTGANFQDGYRSVFRFLLCTFQRFLGVHMADYFSYFYVSMCRAIRNRR